MKGIKILLVTISFLSTTVCFSQNDRLILKNREFSTEQIDSICENNDYKIISEGRTGAEMKIESNKEPKLIKGKGGFSYTIYPLFFDEAHYKTLTKKEQNTYKFKENTRLLKGIFSSGIHYENSYAEITIGEFYYFNDALFQVKIQLTKREKDKKDTIQVFDLSTTELNNSKTIENILSMDLKSWINEESNKIIKIYNN